MIGEGPLLRLLCCLPPPQHVPCHEQRKGQGRRHAAHVVMAAQRCVRMQSPDRAYSPVRDACAVP
jgi:hypothetical protein